MRNEANPPQQRPTSHRPRQGVWGNREQPKRATTLVLRLRGRPQSANQQRARPNLQGQQSQRTDHRLPPPPSGSKPAAATPPGPATNVTVNSLTATLDSDNTFAKDGFTLADGTN